MYPFTPAAEGSRNLVAGIRDAFFVIKGASDPGPWTESSSSGSTDDSPWPVPKDYFGVLYGLTSTPASVVYVFYAKAPGGYWSKLTFTASRDGGVMRVDSAESPSSFLILDTDRLTDWTGSVDELWAELEPSRLVFQLNEVTGVRLVNEYREHDTRVRSASLEDNPDDTIVRIDEDGDTLRLVDGYNCSLSYDEDTGTLLVEAGPGLGKGKPKSFPWDSDAPDQFEGVKTVNGQNNDGDAHMNFKKGVLPVYAPNKLTMRIREE